MAAPSKGGLARTDFVFMLVALYFILISFFIIISTISVKDSEKLQEAVNSIAKTFKLNDRIAVVDKKREPNSYASFLNDLQNWIGNLYALGNVSINKRGSQILITVKHPRFFTGGTVEFTEEARRAMQTLAELITNWQSEYLNELTIVNQEPSATGPGSAPMLTPSRHAAAIAAALAQHGVNPQAFTVGVREAAESRISFNLKVRVPPKIDQDR